MGVGADAAAEGRTELSWMTGCPPVACLSGMFAGGGGGGRAASSMGSAPLGKKGAKPLPGMGVPMGTGTDGYVGTESALAEVLVEAVEELEEFGDEEDAMSGGEDEEYDADEDDEDEDEEEAEEGGFWPPPPLPLPLPPLPPRLAVAVSRS